MNMEITITPAAAEKIHALKNRENGILKLKWDTEGNGCVLNGIPTLWYVDEADPDHDVLLQTNAMPILVEKPKMVFYDEAVKIDFSQEANTFQLKSANQMLNGRMAFRNK